MCGVTYESRQADGSWHCKVCGKNVCQSRDFGGLPLSMIEAMLNDVNKLGNPASDRVTHGSVRYWFNNPWELSRFLMAVIRQTTTPAPERVRHE